MIFVSGSNRKTAPAWRLLFIALLIFAGWGALRHDAGLNLFVYQDKLIHASVYTILYVIGWLAYSRSAVSLPLHISLLAYGAGIEWLQSLTGYRDAELADLAANFAGQCLGNACVLLYLKNLAGRG